MAVSIDRYVFFCNTLLKLSLNEHHQSPLEFLGFPSHKSLCIVSILKEYLVETKDIRSENNFTTLLINYQRPYRPASKDTIRRWIQHVMELTGINVSTFTAHSHYALYIESGVVNNSNINSSWMVPGKRMG